MASSEDDLRLSLETLHDMAFAALDRQQLDAESYMVIHRKMKIMFAEVYEDLLRYPEEAP